jgi:O-antigen/teichoic acid export membrane protein
MIARYGNDRVKRGLLHFFVGKSVSALGGLLAMLLVVHALPIADFARYSILIGLVEIFTGISGLGLSHVILRYVPELYASYQTSALRAVVLATFSLRTLVLVFALGLAWIFSDSASSLIGLNEALGAFEAFLLVVALRSTNQYLSQILESTLHQGKVQAAFSFIAIGRCVGMLWLISNDSANLTNVILLEAVCEFGAMLMMLNGIFATLWVRKPSEAAVDNDWHNTNRKQVIRFAASAYLQHLATLPFGGNTNRLVGGSMFSDQVMARFGFAQSLYEYVKRYLPTQLLIGMIRPVVVARFTSTRDFSAASALCERSLQVNLALLAGLIAVLLVDGRELLLFISAGKYGASGLSVMIFVALLVLLIFETQRVVLELLSQMVEHYEILIPSNVFLGFSVFGAVAAFPLMGPVAFPIANVVAIFLANLWVIHRLASLGFHYQHDWKATLQSLLILIVSAGAGILSKYFGLHWIGALLVTLSVFALCFWKLKFALTVDFARELIGTDKKDNGMDVGIISMQRVMNYGSFMQAYALKSTIESMGHHVTFRDFQNGNPRHKGEKVKAPRKPNRISRIPQILSDIDGTLKKLKFRRNFKRCFKQTCWPLLGMSVRPSYNLNADAVVIGSDEVFNYTQNQAFGYVPCLFGHQINAPLIVSYAASAGYANWDDVIADGMEEELASGLRRMKHVSVRDENTRRLVEGCLGVSPPMVIDPTLIYDFEHLTPQHRLIRFDYILIYAYEGRMDSEEEIHRVRDFATRNNLRVVSAGAYHEWCDENIVVSPFELLSVFRDAAFVVTDTFHGSIFSMKHSKQFATFLRDANPLGSNSNKVSYLLQQFGMESRIVKDISTLGEVLTTPAPYEVFSARLSGLRQVSLDFLKMALG